MADNMQMHENRKKGIGGERAAKAFLKKLRYKFVESNYQNKAGEIDLIFMHKRTLIFVEVKSRESDRFGLPVEAVTEFKRNKIRRAAEIYLLKTDLKYDGVRFDIISIMDGKIEHFIDAF